jgi:integrase
MNVKDITPDDVKSVVRTSPQPNCIFQAIRQAFEFAIWEGYCTDNPAHPRIMRYLGKRPTTHFKAMDYSAIPAFMQQLRARQRPGVLGPSAIEFLVLTAARANEVAAMTWDEVNFNASTWTIPATRTKTGREHRVPLSSRPMELLGAQSCALSTQPHVLSTQNPTVWLSYTGRPITPKCMYHYLTRYMGVRVTIHGFRASFSSWCYDKMDFPEELVEKCLSHQTTKVISAYRRTDALERRRAIMEVWADYCG